MLHQARTCSEEKIFKDKIDTQGTPKGHIPANSDVVLYQIGNKNAMLEYYLITIYGTDPNAISTTSEMKNIQMNAYSLSILFTNIYFFLPTKPLLVGFHKFLRSIHIFLKHTYNFSSYINANLLM